MQNQELKYIAYSVKVGKHVIKWFTETAKYAKKSKEPYLLNCSIGSSIDLDNFILKIAIIMIH